MSGRKTATIEYSFTIDRGVTAAAAATATAAAAAAAAEAAVKAAQRRKHRQMIKTSQRRVANHVETLRSLTIATTEEKSKVKVAADKANSISVSEDLHALERTVAIVAEHEAAARTVVDTVLARQRIVNEIDALHSRCRGLAEAGLAERARLILQELAELRTNVLELSTPPSEADKRLGGLAGRIVVLETAQRCIDQGHEQLAAYNKKFVDVGPIEKRLMQAINAEPDRALEHLKIMYREVKEAIDERFLAIAKAASVKQIEQNEITADALSRLELLQARGNPLCAHGERRAPSETARYRDALALARKAIDSDLDRHMQLGTLFAEVSAAIDELTQALTTPDPHADIIARMQREQAALSHELNLVRSLIDSHAAAAIEARIEKLLDLASDNPDSATGAVRAAIRKAVEIGKPTDADPQRTSLFDVIEEVGKASQVVWDWQTKKAFLENNLSDPFVGELPAGERIELRVEVTDTGLKLDKLDEGWGESCVFFEALIREFKRADGVAGILVRRDNGSTERLAPEEVSSEEELKGRRIT